MRNIINNKGFTLLEMLVSLYIFSLTMFLIVNFYTSLGQLEFENHQNKIDYYIANLQLELIKTKDIFCRDQKLDLILYNNQEISYFLKNNNLIRQVDMQGNEIVIYDVGDYYFFQENNLCKVRYGENFDQEKIIGTILNK